MYKETDPKTEGKKEALKKLIKIKVKVKMKLPTPDGGEHKIKETYKKDCA